jgi:hypothetical protein
MNAQQLSLLLYFQAVNIPNYLLSGIVFCLKKLEENKIASELEKMRAIVINPSQLVPFL